MHWADSATSAAVAANLTDGAAQRSLLRGLRAKIGVYCHSDQASGRASRKGTSTEERSILSALQQHVDAEEPRCYAYSTREGELLSEGLQQPILD